MGQLGGMLDIKPKMPCNFPANLDKIEMKLLVPVVKHICSMHMTGMPVQLVLYYCANKC